MFPRVPQEKYRTTPETIFVFLIRFGGNPILLLLGPPFVGEPGILYGEGCICLTIKVICNDKVSVSC